MADLRWTELLNCLIWIRFVMMGEKNRCLSSHSPISCSEFLSSSLVLPVMGTLNSLRVVELMYSTMDGICIEFRLVVIVHVQTEVGDFEEGSGLDGFNF